MGYAQPRHGDHHTVKGCPAGTVLFAVGGAEQVIKLPEEIHAQAFQ